MTITPAQNNTPATITAEFTIEDNIAGTNFQVRVQALGANHIPSLWAYSVNALTRLAKANLQPITLDGDVITATLENSVNNADAYQAQLVIDDKPHGDFIPMTSAPER